MAAAGNSQIMSTGYYDQAGYVSAPGSTPPMNNGRDSGFPKVGQVNHDDPPFSRYFSLELFMLKAI